eukprot:4770259-Amphidinium_carterae.1
MENYFDKLWHGLKLLLTKLEIFRSDATNIRLNHLEKLENTATPVVKCASQRSTKLVKQD